MYLSSQTKAGETGTRYEYQSWSDGQAAVPLVDDAPDVDDVYGDIREAVQFDDVIESCGRGFGVSRGGELVECGGDDNGCDGDGESGVPVYGMERGVIVDGQSSAGDRDGRAEGIDGEVWEAGGVHGGERTFGPSGGGGRGDVHDAAGRSTGFRGRTYDRGDVSSVGGGGDPVSVSGVE